MKDWIEKMLSFLGDVIKFISPVITFFLGIFYERMKLKKKVKNLKQIILKELLYFLATSILYSLKCYMHSKFVGSIEFLYWDISALESKRKKIKDEAFDRRRIETIERKIKDLEEKIERKVISILNNRKSIEELFGWIFALSKKYEESFPKEIVKYIKDLQDSIEDFYDKLEKFHKGLIDGEFVSHFREKYRSIKPEIEDIYFDMKLTNQNLTDIKCFDKELTKEITEILNSITRLSNKKSNYVKPHSCTEFVEEVKSLVFKIDKLLEKERVNL
jgi:flagellar biosynthesis regulator FlaF